MNTILLIDDDREFREISETVLSEAGYEVYTVSAPDEAFAFLLEGPVDLILCDLHLPFTTGPEIFHYKYSYEVGLGTIQELTQTIPEVPLGIVSATMPWDFAAVLGPLNYLPRLSKPCSNADLLTFVEKLFRPEGCVLCQ